MKKILAGILGLVPAFVLAQDVLRVSGTGRANVASLNVGQSVEPNRGIQENGQPEDENKIYTTGEYWTGSDTYPDEFADGYTTQIVTNPAGLTDSTSNYLQFTARRAMCFYVCRDDDNTTSYSSGWLDTGLDVIRDVATQSCLVKTFPAGAVNIPGNAGDAGTQQYILFARDATRCVTSVAASGGSGGNEGTLQFSLTSYSGDEDNDITFQVDRVGGNSGAASVVVSETAGLANGVLNDLLLSWTDGDAASKQGTITPADVTGNQVMTIQLSSFVGATAGAITSADIFITDNDTAPSAADYYVNQTVSCSDSWDGEFRTPQGGSSGPWCSPTKCNSIAHPGGAGHVNCWLETDTYTGYKLQFTNSGLSHTQRLRICAIGGDVELRWNSSGSSTSRIIEADTNYTQYGGCDSNRISYDGQASYARLQAPSGARITQGGSIRGDFNIIDVDGNNTAGWNGWHIYDTSQGGVIRGDFDFHGQPWYTVNPDSDWGDLFTATRNDGSHYWFLDGCQRSTGLFLSHGGHSLGQPQGGRFMGGCAVFNNSWADVATYNSDEGDRAFVFDKNVRDSLFFDMIVNRNGKPADQDWQELAKGEGRNNAYVLCLFRNSQGMAHNTTASSWAYWGEGGRVYHCVYENLAGPVAVLRDYNSPLNPSSGQRARMGKYIWKNFSVLGFGQNGSNPWGTNNLFSVVLSGTGLALTDVLELHGGTIEHSSGSCDTVQIQVIGATPNIGTRSLNYLMETYPSNFSNLNCTTDANYDNAPSAATDVDLTDWKTLYTPVSDALSTDTGVDLTYASNSGTNSTNLCGLDVIGFPDPSLNGGDDPAYGSFAGGFELNINGTNVGYTDRTDNPTPAGCFTLDTPQTWTFGDPINFPIRTGSAPDRNFIL